MKMGPSRSQHGSRQRSRKRSDRVERNQTIMNIMYLKRIKVDPILRRKVIRVVGVMLESKRLSHFVSGLHVLTSTHE